ncbi:MAG: alanine--tRNA ligase [Legionellales bacterium]|nr:MAG: alanine--tRNA ligase [Legionellales bacterium]
MLGNFSFGEYSKKQAILYAWDFLTKELNVPAEKLWITVFDKDQEAADVWLNVVGVSKDRFSYIGEKDNFWSMGDTGPCGPCSEIFYDHGADIPGGPPGSENEDADRYVEIWNLVFMQYERSKDGKLLPLKVPCVDTGMGLERITAVTQNVSDNYDTDLFLPIRQQIQKLSDSNINNPSNKVIADHIRACVFLISDGVLPGNEGRDYVLRRIIRRALRHGQKLGITQEFLHTLVSLVVNVMQSAYPELQQQESYIVSVLETEEKQFAQTLKQGLKILTTELAQLSSKTIPGDLAFKLYDTYGFPLDLTQDIAREKNLTVDVDAFNVCMQQQKARARAKSGFKEYASLNIEKRATDFVGYELIEDTAKVLVLLQDAKEVSAIKSGDSAMLILDKTPFYAESGGQVGDQGILQNSSGTFLVTDVKKVNGNVLHCGVMQSGTFGNNENITATVNAVMRKSTARNHTATHLLHAALRKVLGEHVLQKGSLVHPEYLRFDFSHNQAVTEDEIQVIENIVNQKIIENHKLETIVTNQDEAKSMGAMALFGEKYDAKVRVLKIADFSMELCGGTHVVRTGDIGLFKIISEASIASGIRRIESVTGNKAIQWVQSLQQQFRSCSHLLDTTVEKFPTKLQQFLEQSENRKQKLRQLEKQILSVLAHELVNKAKQMNDINLIVAKVENPASELRTLVENIKQLASKKTVIVLASKTNDRASIVTGITRDIQNTYGANELIKFLAPKINGKGGGRADFAQAGGSDVNGLEGCLDSVEKWIIEN